VERKSGLEEVSNNIEKFINDNNLVKRIQVTSNAKGIVMYAEGDLFFDVGSADVKDEIKRFLTRIAGIVKKSQYKVLVKRHHPDTNGGDRAAEERIKHINRAYETVINTLVP